MAKHSIQIDDDKLFEEIVAYCKLNNLQIKMFCKIDGTACSFSEDRQNFVLAKQNRI